MCPSGDVLMINSSHLFAYTAFSVKKKKQKQKHKNNNNNDKIPLHSWD